MPDTSEPEWQPDFFNQMRLTNGPWDGSGQQMGGMQDVDLRMFQHDNNGHSFEIYDDKPTQQHYPPVTGHLANSKWASDVDMDTPPVAGFATGFSEGYHAAQASNSGHLQPPPPRDVSETASADQRPGIGRRSTAPEPRIRRLTTSTLEPPALKRSGTSEDGEDEYMPCEDPKNRGRKRQRIPHTAVERRYRENLNAHLDKLRQTVPALAARGGEKHEGVKPSKCEVLSGAIDHIGALDKENQALRSEVKLMGGRLEELESWYRRSHRGNGFGA
ncbi:hypothetical protein LTR08_001109 [Meristemomyces frigidus]|nr:hypothetical protein LTR08_001109 [Meristemomyces frigidus]